jgi:hypothetical protein
MSAIWPKGTSTGRIGMSVMGERATSVAPLLSDSREDPG